VYGKTSSLAGARAADLCRWARVAILIPPLSATEEASGSSAVAAFPKLNSAKPLWWLLPATDNSFNG
jgi:hypothetical protein